ncbi:MAG: iron-containing alcohol dehydrogenase [Desulfarculales bacterium]|jgi:alcohol dehydrogenase YqhD (iron-dependent ADH family)|nr:iron-containing alcohol dehydrogenase [Desulfarculales bacterium]
MQNFNYCNKTRLVFGKDSHKEIGRLIRPHTGKVLLHFGGGSIKKSGLYDEVRASLSASGITATDLGGVQPNPLLSLVREGINICRAEKIKFILAVGGGSVIDSAKAIALGVPYEGDVWDFFLSVEKTAQDVLPVATVLTLPGTGSEASWSTVITKAGEQRKLVSNREISRPLLSVINPELFFTLPASQIANGACDMLCHVMERYFTNTVHTDVIDGMCESVMKNIIRHSLILMNDSKNYESWAELSLAGTIAHNGILGLGRAEDWASHRIEHELSAVYNVAHGAGLAVVFPAWMGYVYESNVPMFAQFAVKVMGAENGFRPLDELALEGIARLKKFFAGLGLPANLRELGIDAGQFENMARMATAANSGQEKPLGGMRKIYWQDALAILELANQ